MKKFAILLKPARQAQEGDEEEGNKNAKPFRYLGTRQTYIIKRFICCLLHMLSQGSVGSADF